MTESYQPSVACCNTPAVIGPPYDPQGSFEEIDGIETYVAGPSDAKKAVFMIYDVFGYSSQILEGADKLATSYRIFMPDFFNGDPAPLEWGPIDGELDGPKLDEWIARRGDTDEAIQKLNKLMEVLRKSYPGVESWALVGYCWGGWITSVTVSKQHDFKACAVLHGGFPEAEDAAKVRTPMLALNSKEETPDQYEHFEAALKVDNHFITFDTMVHGWLSARGDLAKPDVRAKFDEGYQMILEWFGKYL